MNTETVFGTSFWRRRSQLKELDAIELAYRRGDIYIGKALLLDFADRYRRRWLVRWVIQFKRSVERYVASVNHWGRMRKERHGEWWR